MEFAVNIKRIKDHIAILRKEKYTADELIASLKKLQYENTETMIYDPILLQRQLVIAGKIADNIQRRIHFLELSEEEFQRLTHSVDSIFNDALALAKNGSVE